MEEQHFLQQLEVLVVVTIAVKSNPRGKPAQTTAKSAPVRVWGLGSPVCVWWLFPRLLLSLDAQLSGTVLRPSD